MLGLLIAHPSLLLTTAAEAHHACGAMIRIQDMLLRFIQFLAHKSQPLVPPLKGEGKNHAVVVPYSKFGAGFGRLFPEALIRRVPQ